MKAEEHFLASLEMIPDVFFAECLLGQAQYKAGHHDKAAATLTRTLGHYERNRHRWPIYDIKGRYYLGLSQEALGKNRDAIVAYTAFLSFWGEADFASVEVDDARRRLTRLKSNL